MTQEKLEKIKKEISESLCEETWEDYFNTRKEIHSFYTDLVEFDITMELECNYVEDGDGYWTPRQTLRKDCCFINYGIECNTANEDELTVEELESISEELIDHIATELETIIADYDD